METPLGAGLGRDGMPAEPIPIRERLLLKAKQRHRGARTYPLASGRPRLHGIQCAAQPKREGPMSVRTLSELFLKAASYNKPDCLLSKVGGSFQPISTAELVDRVRRLSKTLLELGVAPGDRVALLSENGPHWPTVDFATLCAGAVLVPIYPTMLPDQATYSRSNVRL